MNFPYFECVIKDSRHNDCLEQVADVFLSPGRYLAAVNGWQEIRVFHIDVNERITESSFLEEEHPIIRIIKVVLAIFAVIPATILGCCLKDANHHQISVKSSQNSIQASGILRKNNTMTKKLEDQWRPQEKNYVVLFGISTNNYAAINEIFFKHITPHLSEKEFLNLNLVSKAFWLALHSTESSALTAVRAYQMTLNGMDRIKNMEEIKTIHDLSCRAYDYTRKMECNNEVLTSLFSLHHFLKLPLAQYNNDDLFEKIIKLQMSDEFTRLPSLFRIVWKPSKSAMSALKLQRISQNSCLINNISPWNELIVIKYTFFLPKEAGIQKIDSVRQEIIMIQPESGLTVDYRYCLIQQNMHTYRYNIDGYVDNEIKNEAYTKHFLIDYNKFILEDDTFLTGTEEFERLQNLINHKPIGFFGSFMERPDYIEGLDNSTFKGERMFRDLPVLLGHVGIEAFDGLFQSETRERTSGNTYEYITF